MPPTFLAFAAFLTYGVLGGTTFLVGAALLPFAAARQTGVKLVAASALGFLGLIAGTVAATVISVVVMLIGNVVSDDILRVPLAVGGLCAAVVSGLGGVVLGWRKGWRVGAGARREQPWE